MKVFVYSDVHKQELIIPDKKPDAVLLLGDIDWRDVKRLSNHFTNSFSNPVPLIGVLGNHDVLDTFVNTNVIHVHGKTVELNGVVFAGFGGSPRYNNKHNSAQYEEWEAHEYIRDLKEVDVFLAHSNPAFQKSFDSTDSHRGFNSFKELLDKNNVKTFFHGHLHENKEYIYNDTKIVSTYGFREYEL
ncbi:hypothetical protein COA01_34340 [Bacillus cereus]|uniref:metallophosphoesterase family protein n=1 Tax=Bacillus cereus TaxID=1396 RepID=UPI000BFE83B5|nr:metallophosphoesterase [Bacillus cereus]PGP11902.1 hypothetical protein COA01_34340 [Bacillus cereus]